MFDPNVIVANVGALPAAAGTVYMPIFQVPSAGGRITLISAQATLFPAGTCTLNLVDLGHGGTSGMVNAGTLFTLGSGGTETVYGAGTPISGTEVSAVVSPGHYIGVKCQAGTASTATLIEIAYINAVVPS
jgi:hypothetical protein